MKSSLVRDKKRGVMYPMLIAATLLAAGPAIADDDEDDRYGGTIPFADTGIIFETNFTDKDTGIQISLDGEPWKEVKVKGPDGFWTRSRPSSTYAPSAESGSRKKRLRELVEVENDGNLEDFGLTNLLFESNEPNYDELPLADILALFPAGEYKFKGKTVEGDRLEGEATLTHVLPCGPEVSVTVVDADNVTISWDPVTQTIDPVTETCVDPAESLVIDGYQVIVENDHTFSVDLPDDATSVKVPPEFLEFLEPGSEYKVEVLAIEESGNQTITEDGFRTALALSVPYAYRGNNFNDGFFGELFSTNDRVTAQFTLDCDAAHAAGNCRNLPYADYRGAVEIEPLSFSAGPASLPTADGRVEIAQFSFSTDSEARIVDWDMDLFLPDPSGVINVDTDNVTAEGRGIDSAAALGSGGSTALGNPGEWRVMPGATQP